MISKILIGWGSRPERIKLEPVFREFDKYEIPFISLFTGQHPDLVQTTERDVIFTLDMENSISRLNSCSNQIQNLLCDYLESNKNIEYVMVQGDTVSAYACAMAAFHMGRKVIHLEAGLRTWDKSNPWPEEAYRYAISGVASINFCATDRNLDNLGNLRESSEWYVVGNTGMDNLAALELPVTYEDQILITLHRRENHEIIDQWFKEINELAKANPHLHFILPLHPNPNVQKHKGLLTNVFVVNPLSHKNCLELISRCKMGISDSGGLQEEFSWFKKKLIVCRKVTERPESLGKTSFLCPHPSNLKNLFNDIIADFKPSNHPCCFGDGKTAQKVANILYKRLHG